MIKVLMALLMITSASAYVVSIGDHGNFTPYAEYLNSTNWLRQANVTTNLRIDNLNSSLTANISSTAGWYNITNKVITSGIVGIGTTNPSATLDVNGNMNLAEASGRKYMIGGRAAIESLGANAGLAINRDIDYTDLYLRANTSKYVYIDQGQGLYVTNNITAMQNIGIGTVSPRAKLEVIGTSRFTSNMTILSNVNISGGNLNIGGLLTVQNGQNDLTVSLSSTRAASANPANCETIFRGNTLACGFSNSIAGQEENVYFSMQYPHNIDDTKPLSCHVHYSCPTATTQNVSWRFEYTQASLNNVYPATVSLYSTASCTNVAYNHTMAYFSNITLTSPAYSGVLLGRLYRDSANATDTYTGTAIATAFDCHYEYTLLNPSGVYPINP